MTAFWFVVDVFACYRLTRLIVEDSILDRPRTFIVTRSTYLGELVTCWWCAGIWMGAAVVAARRVAPGVWTPVAVALALATFAAIGGQLGRQ